MPDLFRGLVAVAFLAIGTPAFAGLGPNGLGPNGLGPNGLGPNGLGPNGLGPNGLGPNGLGPNGLGPNGLGPNGLGPNGLGPNGLGPNGLGPNGLDVNGLGPNGLGPNGLGPNGLVYLVTPAGVQLTYDAYGVATGVARDSSGNLIPVPTFFGDWFDKDPAAAAQFMKYFARCAYDAQTGIAWIDGTGKTWLWTGQYGLAMGSLNGAALEPLGQCVIPDGTSPAVVSPTCTQQVRARMTVDEGRWVSSCLLAHVNLQGLHQYISIRGSPPNPEAQAALAVSTNESVFMPQYFGMFFADLYAPEPFKGACSMRSQDDWSVAKIDLVLGRDCDVRGCSYPDPASTTTPPAMIPLERFFGWCLEPASHWGDSPTLTFYPSTSLQGIEAVSVRDVPGPLRPLKIHGPNFSPAVPDAAPIYGADGHTIVGWKATKFGFRDVARCVTFADARRLEPGQGFCESSDPASFTGRIDVAQVIECGHGKCLGGNPFTTGGGYGADARTFALVDMVANQAADWASNGRGADLSQPVTAIVRYSKDRTANAHVLVSGPDGNLRDVSGWIGEAGAPDIWPATGAGTWDYLQIYPVHIRKNPSAGFSLGRSCTSGADCASGLGLTCRDGLCVVGPTASGDPSQPSWSCPGAPGQLQLYELGVSVYSSTPACVEACTSDAQCSSGDSCLSGRCVAPTARVRVAGAAMSESCTGPTLFKGPNEAGSCSYPFKASSLKANTVCPKENEDGTPCRGSLVWGKRQNVTGWFCRGGGEALYACLPEDAPDLDAVGFIPGRPWCAPDGAESFVGMCK